MTRVTVDAEALAYKHLSLAHTRLGQIAFTAAQEGKHETARLYRAAQSVVADEIGQYRMALAAQPLKPQLEQEGEQL